MFHRYQKRTTDKAKGCKKVNNYASSQHDQQEKNNGMKGLEKDEGGTG